MIVYTDVHELPADAAGVALAGAVAGDAMTRTGELAQLLDVVSDVSAYGTKLRDLIREGFGLIVTTKEWR